MASQLEQCEKRAKRAEESEVGLAKQLQQCRTGLEAASKDLVETRHALETERSRAAAAEEKWASRVEELEALLRSGCEDGQNEAAELRTAEIQTVKDEISQESDPAKLTELCSKLSSLTSADSEPPPSLGDGGVSRSALVRLVQQQYSQIDALSAELGSLTAERNELRICERCRLAYTEAANSEAVCSFHPGQLRYFSCRGCGADAYFSCCNKCVKCSAGCRTSRHVS